MKDYIIKNPKKSLWIPLLGIYAVIYYHFIKREPLVTFQKPGEFFLSAIWQALSATILISMPISLFIKLLVL